MKNTLTHLPEHKQEELQTITAFIKQKLRVEMIILFGSYARGDWQEDRYVENGITYEYQSDYDILVVVEKEVKINKSTKAHTIRSKIRRHMEDKTPVTIIYHGIDYLNAEIENNSYFFNDIRKEGIMLFDTGRHALSEPKELSQQQRQKNAQEHFDMWFKNALMCLETYYIHIEKSKTDKDYYRKAAFELHQVAENLYVTIHLVFTDYKPKTHDLKKLDSQARKFNPKVKPIFPQDTPEKKALFIKLVKAYIDARYKINYKVTIEELTYFSERVEILKTVTEAICKAKIQAITS